jgi:hypothetical protein
LDQAAVKVGASALRYGPTRAHTGLEPGLLAFGNYECRSRTSGIRRAKSRVPG